MSADVRAYTVGILGTVPKASDVTLVIVIAGLNGIPMGAKFLSDAILADVIDYDEFLYVGCYAKFIFNAQCLYGCASYCATSG